jgi:hypothetical protein
MDYINNLDWIDGIELINKAILKQRERQEWEMWLTLYPNMDKKNFISFEKFKSNQRSAKPKKPKKVLTDDEIIEKAEEIRKIHQGKHEGVVRKVENINGL